MKIQDLGVWEAFHHVATEGSFTRAARKMRIGVPLLSKRIARLEGELGVRLFHRSTRSVSLTAEGRGLLPHLASVLEDLRGIERRFEEKGELAGTIRMTCLPALAHRVLAPMLADFQAAHPEIRFDLDLSDHIVDLIAGQFDLAIRIDEPSDTDLVYKRLAANRLVICASPDYLKRAKAPLRKPQDLRQHPVLDLHVHDWARFRDSRHELREYTSEKWIRCESGVFLTELALRGAGVTVRSMWDVGRYLESGELVQVLKGYPLEDFGEIHAVIPSRRYLAHRIRVFIDFLGERMASVG